MANDKWAAVLKSKISEVLADTSVRNLSADISRPDEKLAQTIDHTLLKQDATPALIDALCDEAIKYRFKSCCINGTNVKQVADRLRARGSDTLTCAVIGFPLGAMKTSVKIFEATEAIADGAQEIDMVVNIGALKARDYELVYTDIRSVVEACAGNAVKVILETIFLTKEEIIAASYISAEAGAAFVKTCTGFAGGAASSTDVALMAKSVAYKEGVKVKASAGVRTFEKCLVMIKSGAGRIGTSSAVAIMEEENADVVA